MNARAANPNRILVVLFVGVLLGALDIAIVGPTLPAMRAGFGADERAISWVFTIYVLFNLIGTPLRAKLADRLGRRLVHTLDQVRVGRATQAFGAGGIFPVASLGLANRRPA
jgi:MFS family permease